MYEAYADKLLNFTDTARNRDCSTVDQGFTIQLQNESVSSK